MPEDYTQPDLPALGNGRSWPIQVLDYQITTKIDGWNPNQAERLEQYRMATLLNCNYVAIACPYDGLTKFTNFVTDARTSGKKILFRSHWNAWQGQNSVGAVSSLTRSGSTATCTTATNHGFSTGHTAVIAGADQTDYNGEFTITVTGATTFTYTVPGSPATTATGTITWRYGRDTYKLKTYDFIVANPTLFEDGDGFGMCVECNNADGASANWTFRDNGKSSGTFDMTKYNRFVRDQITYANAAFKAIGKNVATWPISLSLSLLDLAGQTLDSGNTGRAGGMTDADIVQYLGGILPIDHYLSNAYRFADATKYWDKLSSDLDKIHVAFPSCKLFIEEWGYHTTTIVPNGEHEAMFEQVLRVFRSKPYICGVSIWVHMGSTTASIFEDSSGTIIVGGGRNTFKAIERAFKAGSSYTGGRLAV